MRISYSSVNPDTLLKQKGPASTLIHRQLAANKKAAAPESAAACEFSNTRS
jgi:hypothetical protein